MTKSALTLLILLPSLLFARSASQQALDDDDPVVNATRKIREEVLTKGRAFEDLKELTALGHRLSGSDGAAKAVEWAKHKMESYGFDRVELQPVMVPKLR